MRRLFYSVFIVLLAALSAWATWTGTSADQIINYDDNMLCWYTRMAVDSEGTIHVVWNEKVVSYPTQQEIHYSRSTDNGVTWSGTAADVIVSYDDAVNAENGSGIAIDSQDNIYVVWTEEDAGVDEVHYSISTDGGNSWSGQTGDTYLSFPGGNNAYNPDIAVDGNDVIHVVWNQVYADVDEIHYARSEDGGLTWTSQTSETVISYSDGDASSYADIVVGPNNELYVMWKENSETVTTHDVLNISISYDGGDTWTGTTGDTPITQPIRIILYPQMEIDSNGYLHAVLKGTQDTVSPFHYEVYYTGSSDGGTTWSGLTQDIVVSFDDGNSSNIPNLGCDSQGNVVVVWDEDYGSGDNEIHVSISTDGGATWSGQAGDEIISYPDGHPAYRPFVIAGNDDMLHATWNEGTQNNYYQIHYSRGDAIGGGTVPMDVELTYVSGSPVPAGGGNLYFDVFVEYSGSVPIDYDAWLDVAYEGGDPTTVVLRSFTNYQPGWTINRPNTWFPVSAGYAAGNYTLTGRVGIHPLEVWDESGFAWVKSGTADNTSFQPFIPANMVNPFIVDGKEAVEFTKPTEVQAVNVTPNPFNPVSTLSFTLQDAGQVRLCVFDLSGRLISELANGWHAVGTHRVTFDGSGLASGVYVYRLEAGSIRSTGKLILMK